MTNLTASHLTTIMPSLSEGDARFYLPSLVAAAEEFDITTNLRMAAFIGNGAYESGEMQSMEELGGPNKSYAPYYGRGFMQLTGIDNYRAASQYFGQDFVSNPDLVSRPEWAFRTAGWFFRYGNGDQVPLADAGDFWDCYLRVLGSDNGTFPERRAYYDRAMRVLPATITTDLAATIPTGGDRNGGRNMANGQSIVNAAYEVLSAPYRVWEEGDSIPMWLDDGVSDPPPASHIMWAGIECSDLINYALERNGLDPVGGTGALMDTIEGIVPFDANAPGVPGAVAFSPYTGPALSQQGHILLYTGAHSTIQALFDPGVTDAYTDYDTAAFLAGGLDYYGFLPGVDYSDAPTAPSPGVTASAPKWLAINNNGVLVANGSDYSKGWYDTGWRRGDWSWHGPKEG